jgi:hypothetical protein
MAFYLILVWIIESLADGIGGGRAAAPRRSACQLTCPRRLGMIAGVRASIPRPISGPAHWVMRFYHTFGRVLVGLTCVQGHVEAGSHSCPKMGRSAVFICDNRIMRGGLWQQQLGCRGLYAWEMF